MNDDSPEFRVTMPREFFLLIDYLHKQGPLVEGAFSLSSLEFKRAKDVKFNCIRDWLDTWSTNEFRKLLFSFCYYDLKANNILFQLIHLMLRLKLYLCYSICLKSLC